MATQCFAPVFGKRIRVTKLDACGNVPGSAVADSQVATGGFITVSLSSEVESGAEVITKRADGSICVNERQQDSFKRFTVEIEFCGVNPSLLALTTNAETYAGYGTPVDIVGITVPEGKIDRQFALEMWTGLSGEACAPGVEEASGYFLLPFVQAGVLGDISVENENAVSFTMTGAYTKGGNTWGVGPYDVVADALGADAGLPTALDPLDHLLIMMTGLAPPPEACSPGPMPTIVP